MGFAGAVPLFTMLMQGAATLQKGRQQARAYEAAAKAAEGNAAIEERHREEANRANLGERLRLAARRELVTGQNRAAFGAAGFDGMSGTALESLMANEAVFREDSDRLSRNLAIEDNARRQKIANYYGQAATLKKAAKTVRRGAAGEAILATAGSIYGLNLKRKKKPAAQTERPGSRGDAGLYRMYGELV